MGINLGEIEGIAVGAAGKASSRAREEYQERKRVIAEATSGEEAMTAVGSTEGAKNKAAAREPGHRLTPLATGRHATSGPNHAHGSPQEELRYRNPGILHDDCNIFNAWSH